MTCTMYEYANQTVWSSRRCVSSSSAPTTSWVPFVFITAPLTDEVNNWCLSFPRESAIASHPSEERTTTFKWVSNLLKSTRRLLQWRIFKKIISKKPTIRPVFFGTCTDKHEFPQGLAENTNFSLALLFCPAHLPIKTQKTRPGLHWFPLPLLGTDVHIHWSWTGLKRVESYNNWTPEKRIRFFQRTMFSERKHGQKRQNTVNTWEPRMREHLWKSSLCLCTIQMHMYPLYMVVEAEQLLSTDSIVFPNWQQHCWSRFPSTTTTKTS